MNIYRTVIRIFSLIVLATALFSCQKAEPVLIFTAGIEQSGTKTTISIDGSTAKINWEATDQITITDANSKTAVYGVKSGTEGHPSATFEKVSSDAGFGTAPFTAVYGTVPSPSEVQTYSPSASVPVYMTAPPSGTTNLTFTAQCGILKLHLTQDGKNVRKISLSDGTDKFTLACKEAVSISGSGADFFIALPAKTYNSLKVFDGEGHRAEKYVSIEISVNKLKPATNTSTLEFNGITDVLPGVFTVNDKGNWIHFSKGNLKASYMGGWTWSFYDHQYSCNSINSTCVSGERTAQATDSEIDLFTWGYNETKSIIPDGSDKDNVSRMTGDLNNTEDWGPQVGAPGTWRTLTNEEWSYLFGRTVNGHTGQGHTYQNTTITLSDNTTTVSGLIIAPDNYTNDLKSTYTWEGWQTAEHAGCVFLPSAGYRNGANIVNVGELGFYWSATAHNTLQAYYIFFNGTLLYPNSIDSRGIGYSVRLVTTD